MASCSFGNTTHYKMPTTCQQLEAFAPKALDLELYECGKLQLDWGTMKKLTMGGPNMETSLLEIVGSNTLERLEIYSPLRLINDDSLCGPFHWISSKKNSHPAVTHVLEHDLQFHDYYVGKTLICNFMFIIYIIWNMISIISLSCFSFFNETFL